MDGYGRTVDQVAGRRDGAAGLVGSVVGKNDHCH
jgi:hypothetical protein